MFAFLTTSKLEASLESNLIFLTNKKVIIGNMIITKIEIDIQILLQSKNVNKKIINNGKINSAKDNPNQVVLKALPLLFSKNRAIVVVAAWDIKPCPESLIKKIEKNKKTTDDILENMKHEIANNVIT